MTDKKFKLDILQMESLKKACSYYLAQFENISDMLQAGYCKSLELYVVKRIFHQVSKKLSVMEREQKIECKITFDLIEVHVIEKALSPFQSQDYFAQVHAAMEQVSLLIPEQNNQLKLN